MKSEKQINYDRINDLYMGWLNESDPFVQRKRKEDIKATISPYELLMYSIRYALPFEAFKNIFPLADLLRTLEEMQKQGEDISYITNKVLVISSIEDIQALNRFIIKEPQDKIGNFRLRFEGNNIFQYGDIKGIGRKFPNACANYCELESVEQMLRLEKDYTGIPIIITIDNIGQLPLEKLDNIEKHFNVVGIRIIEKNRQIQRHQGEQSPMDLVIYRQIRKFIDDEIISKLYVSDSSENVDRINIDYHLASQICGKLADKIEYDSDTRNKNPLPFTNEMINASGMVGLLTGKSICKGYSEILRNVLSCVDIKSTVIIGKTTNGTTHAWNQIQLGNMWYNTDLTVAREKICGGEISGDLFMTDRDFFGDRREQSFDKGKEINGRSIEATVEIGGHAKPYGINHKCESYISPYLTSMLIKSSKHYNESSKGVVPYVGSSVQKARATSKEFSSSVHSGH